MVIVAELKELHAVFSVGILRELAEEGIPYRRRCIRIFSDQMLEDSLALVLADRPKVGDTEPHIARLCEVAKADLVSGIHLENA